LHILIYISRRWSTPNIIAIGPIVPMLYKVYVNLCDFTAGSYVALGTKELHNCISTCHCDNPRQIVLHLIYWFRRFLKKFPFLVPFWGGYICDPAHFIWTNLNLLAPRMLHAKLKSILASGSWEEDFLSYLLYSYMYM